jgi:hypothetical protein
MNYEPNTTTYPHLVCERVLAEIAAEREIELSKADEDLRRTIINEAQHARRTMSIERRAARLTRRALEEDFTHHDPLFDPHMSPAEVSLIAIGMANCIDREKRISDDTHARLHAVLKAELKVYARANAQLEKQTGVAA